jgi:hypothetical protein
MGSIELREPVGDPLLDHVAVENALLVRRARADLLARAGAVTVDMLADGRGGSEGATRQWLRRHRERGRLITVEHAGRTLVPSFQLDEAFDLDPVVADTIERLFQFGLDAWAVWRWFYAENGWIGQPPVDAAKAGDASALTRAAIGLLEA